MDTKTSTHQMTIKEAVAHFKVSDKTIRRWIQQKKVNAEQVNGRWLVYADADSGVDTDQPVVQPDDQPTAAQVEMMQSEIEHLRDALSRRDTQIDQQNQLLAMLTQQNGQLVNQLPPPSTTLLTRLKLWFSVT